MLTDIHRLIEKYFEGQTSSGEEKMLRDYFAQPGLPDDLKEYAPLFRFLDNESKAIAVLNGIRLDDEAAVRRRQSLRKYGTIAAVAASLFIALILLTPETSSTSQKGIMCGWTASESQIPGRFGNMPNCLSTRCNPRMIS